MGEQVQIRTSTTLAGVVAAMVTVLVLGACSGDEQTGKPGGARGRYIDQVDPICEELNAKIGRLGDDALKQRDEINAALDRINAIPPPGEELDKLKVFLIELNNAALALEDVNQSRLVNNQGRVDTALQTARESDEQAADAADGYGFEQCSQRLES